jgi:predicted RNA-binding protein with RPS1 domain
VGRIHHATVESVRPFGVFVSLPGFQRHALVQANSVAADMRFSREDPDEDKVKALEWVCARGSRVYVKVVEVSEDPVRGGTRIGASMTAVDQSTGGDLDPTGALSAAHRSHGGQGGSEEAPELNSIHRATVSGIRAFGVFVALAGYRKHGLVHSSQVSDHMGFTRDDADEEKVAALSGVVSIGDEVYVKVVEVTPEAGGFKLGCSMKLVNQRTGADLDKAGTQYRPRGAGFGRDEDEPIGRKAAVVKSGVIDWGHHRADVRAADGKAYDLVGDEEGGDWAAPGAAQPPVEDRMVTNANAMARVGGGAAPAGMVGEDDAGEGAPTFASVEEAMAVLERYKRKAAKKEAKKKDKKAKKERKKSERKEKKASKHRGRSSSSSSSSGS